MERKTPPNQSAELRPHCAHTGLFLSGATLHQNFAAAGSTWRNPQDKENQLQFHGKKHKDGKQTNTKLQQLEAESPGTAEQEQHGDAVSAGESDMIG